MILAGAVMRRRLSKGLLIAACYLMAGNAFAGPPFISDDPDSLPKGNGELDLFSSYNHFNPDQFIGFPGVELDYGITNDLEFDGIVTYIYDYPHVSDERNASGFADTSLEAKYRFIHETPTFPEIAFAPIYYEPPGNFNRNLGNGRPWIQLPFWAQKSWGTWTTYGGGGYTLNSAPTTKNFLFGGWVLQKQINDKWNLGGEIYSTGAASQDLKSYTLINLGGVYSFSKNLSILFSAGHNIAGQETTVAYLAFRIDF